MKDKNTSNFIKYLPAIFQKKAEDGGRPFIERFLMIFEQIIIGIDNGGPHESKGIVEKLAVISDVFFPASYLFDKQDDNEVATQKIEFNNFFDTDIEEFLLWMSDWISLVLKEDWELDKKREVLTRMIPIYRKRGTKKGLEEYLKIYVGEDVNITEEVGPFQVEVCSTVEIDTVIEGHAPYCFTVNINLPDQKLLNKKKKTIEDIIETEKPVHTNYKLNIRVQK